MLSICRQGYSRQAQQRWPPDASQQAEVPPSSGNEPSTWMIVDWYFTSAWQTWSRLIFYPAWDIAEFLGGLRWFIG